MKKGYKLGLFYSIKARFILFFVLFSVALSAFRLLDLFGIYGDNLYKYQWGLHGTTGFVIEKNILDANHVCLGFDVIDSESLIYASSDNENIVKENPDIFIAYEKAREMFEKEKKQDIIVAIIDSGIDINHDELKDSIWINDNEIPDNGIDDDNNGYIDDIYGYNFCNDNGKIYVSEDEDVHGTHSAGIISAKHNNGGIKGIAYDNHIKIMSLKILNENGTGKISNFIKAVKYAENQGAKICNVSLGSYTYNKDLENVIKNSNMLFIVSAGNGQNYHGYNIDENKVYPASFNFDNVITVSNVSLDGTLYESSNYGMLSDICAPGTFVLSTIPENKYGYITGTSMAAPFVTSACAMIMSCYDDVNIHNIKKIIVDSATKINELNGIISSSGVLNIYEAMKLASTY